MAATRRLATIVMSVSLLAGGAAALAPAASAATGDCTTYDNDAIANGNGINYRSGPGTSYTSKGLLYKDRLAVYCSSGSWYYTKLVHRSKSGMKAGTAGWVRKDMVKNLLAG